MKLILKFALVMVMTYLLILCCWAIPEMWVSLKALAIVVLAVVAIWCCKKYVTFNDLSKITKLLE